MSATDCSKCHGTGWGFRPFYGNAKPCNCGWQPGGAHRIAAEAEFQAMLAARTEARAARRAARKAVA